MENLLKGTCSTDYNFILTIYYYYVLRWDLWPVLLASHPETAPILVSPIVKPRFEPVFTPKIKAIWESGRFLLAFKFLTEKLTAKKAIVFFKKKHSFLLILRNSFLICVKIIFLLFLFSYFYYYRKNVLKNFIEFLKWLDEELYWQIYGQMGFLYIFFVIYPELICALAESIYTIFMTLAESIYIIFMKLNRIFNRMFNWDTIYRMFNKIATYEIKFIYVAIFFIALLLRRYFIKRRARKSQNKRPMFKLT